MMSSIPILMKMAKIAHGSNLNCMIFIAMGYRFI